MNSYSVMVLNYKFLTRKMCFSDMYVETRGIVRDGNNIEPMVKSMCICSYISTNRRKEVRFFQLIFSPCLWNFFLSIFFHIFCRPSGDNLNVKLKSIRETMRTDINSLHTNVSNFLVTKKQLKFSQQKISSKW